MRLLSTKKMQMSPQSTRTVANEVAKQESNANEGVKHKNKGR